MSMFGSYIRYRDGDEEKAKKVLKLQLHSFIDSLCEKDDFWLKVERDKSGEDLLRLTNQIGWKIDVPHMKDTEINY